MKFDKDKRFNQNVLEYALKLLINPLLVVLFSLVLSLTFHNFLDTMIALISLTVLRYWTGGHHLKSSDLCVVVSVLIIVGIPWLTYIITPALKYIEVLTLILIIALSPFNTYNKDTHYKRKAISTFIVLLNICFHFSPITSVAFLIQSIDLLKLGSVKRD